VRGGVETGGVRERGDVPAKLGESRGDVPAKLGEARGDASAELAAFVRGVLGTEGDLAKDLALGLAFELYGGEK
jgi:hypothetical protein